jgi:tetratricopeptide (TPR) repeat protein
MRRWIAGGAVAALLVAAGAILLADHAPGESKLREELWLLRQKLWVAERNGKKDGATAVRALEALLAKARSENLPDVQVAILDQLAIEYRALAEEYRLGNRYDDAVDAYKALLALPKHLHSDSQRQFYQESIARFACLGERREEGIAQYREMLAADASSGSLTLLGFATCLKAAGRIEESLDVLRKNVQRTYTAVKVRRDDMFRAHADPCARLGRC